MQVRVAMVTRLLLPLLVLLAAAAPCAVVCIAPGDHAATETPFAPCPDESGDCEDVALTLVIAAPAVRNALDDTPSVAGAVGPRLVEVVPISAVASDGFPIPVPAAAVPLPRIETALRI